MGAGGNVALRGAGTTLGRLPRDWRTAEYGTHWRLLEMLFARFPIRSVLETGSGNYSTNLFLNRFKVKRLVSLENNPEWAMQRKPNHEMRVIEGPIAEALPPLADFDLVFIDDDPVSERPQTIEAVLAAPDRPMVVLHDYDYLPFWEKLQGRAGTRETSHMPHTAAVWANPEQERTWNGSQSQGPLAS